MPGVVITQWTGAVDGDYSDNANWTNNVPTTNGTADVYFTTGSVDCNENLPVTADDVDYKQLTIEVRQFHQKAMMLSMYFTHKKPDKYFFTPIFN